MTHRGPFQPLLFCDSVILSFCDSVMLQFLIVQAVRRLHYLFSTMVKTMTRKCEMRLDKIQISEKQ